MRGAHALNLEPALGNACYLLDAAVAALVAAASNFNGGFGRAKPMPSQVTTIPRPVSTQVNVAPVNLLAAKQQQDSKRSYM